MLGLDLGANTIKLVELKKSKNRVFLEAVGIAVNPIGDSLPANQEQRVKLVETIIKLAADTKPAQKKVRLGLPESRAYTRIVKLPIMSEAELSSAIRWEAEQQIPEPLPNVQLDWKIIYRPEKGIKEGVMQVLLVAAKKTYLNQLIDMMAETKLELASIETTTLSLLAGLAISQGPPIILMHIGHSSSDFSIVADGRLEMTYSIPTAGLALTRVVEQTLNLPSAQAEQYKRSYGLDAGFLQGKVKNALLPVFNTIVGEIRKVINSFEAGHPREKIQRGIISGGTALLPEIVSQLTVQLGISETIIANPFDGLALKEGIAVPKETPVYSVAVGLAKGE